VAEGCGCGGAPAARLAAFSAFFWALSWAPVSFVPVLAVSGFEVGVGVCASGFLVGLGGFDWPFVGVGGGAPFEVVGDCGGGIVKVGAVGLRGELI
jgi:hypothetical protein